MTLNALLRLVAALPGTDERVGPPEPMHGRGRPARRAVRRAFKLVNPLAIWMIERLGVGRHNGVVYHVGRRSGREYATPLCMVRTDAGFIVPVAFGPDTDWLANLRKTPQSRVVYERATHQTLAESIDFAQAVQLAGGTGCPCWEQGIESFVLLRPTGES